MSLAVDPGVDTGWELPSFGEVKRGRSKGWTETLGLTMVAKDDAVYPFEQLRVVPGHNIKGVPFHTGELCPEPMASMAIRNEMRAGPPITPPHLEASRRP